MGTSKRIEGAVEELAGRVKAGVGKAIGNEQMEAEGEVASLHGQAKQEAAKAGERVHGKIEEAVGAVKGKVGELIDNEQMEVEGKLKETQGKVRQELNR